MDRLIAGIDPGPEESAVVLFDGGGIWRLWIGENEEVANELRHPYDNIQLVAIEDFAPYGQRIGHESIATIKWIGRFIECAGTGGMNVHAISRSTVKLHLCGVKSVGDPQVRDALIERYGPGRKRAVGTKKAPGPLCGVTGHLWAALAVAVTAYDTQGERHG